MSRFFCNVKTQWTSCLNIGRLFHLLFDTVDEFNRLFLVTCNGRVEVGNIFHFQRYIGILNMIFDGSIVANVYKYMSGRGSGENPGCAGFQ